MRFQLRTSFLRPFVLVCAGILLSVSAPVSAQNAESSGNSAASGSQNAGKKEKKTTLNFEDELVEGQSSKPELFYLFQKKNFNYKRLIRLRENFLPEMRKTSEDIQRNRSSN